MKKIALRFASLSFSLLLVYLSGQGKPVQATTIRFDRFGQVSLGRDGDVLGLIADKGRDEQSGGSGGDDQRGDGRSNISSQPVGTNAPDTAPPASPVSPVETETKKSATSEKKKIKNESREAKESTATQREEKKSEPTLEEGPKSDLKIETKTASGVFKLEIEDGKVRIRRENEQGETENETEASPSAGAEKIEVEESINLKTTKIRALGSRFEIENQGTAAITKLPLAIDRQTNQLIVTTPKKTMRLAILPAQAVANLINRGLIDEAETLLEISKPLSVSSPSAQPGVEEAKTEIIEKNGEAVYRIVGRKTRRLLGLIPTDFKLSAEVNPETGAVVAIEEPLLIRFLGFLFSP